MIHLEQFGWRFAGAPSWALQDVSLHIEPGEFVAVAGPSGSGKTTLALAACGLLLGRHAGDATGTVHVGGKDVAAEPLQRVAETIALVQQNPEAHFATLTVADEIAFGMENRCLAPDDIRRRSAEAMELLSITHLADRSLATLSGGEQQRVAVASIVAGKPDAIVLDEPTASLDPQASRDLFRTLADLCRQTHLTVVIIEHKLAQLLPLNPRLVCLEAGRLSDAPEPSVLSPQSPVLSTHSSVLDAPPIVDASGLTVRLGGRTILDDVSLQVRPGETVAILGPNGGGKSTLLHGLLGLVASDRGSVRVCDLPVPETPVSRLAAHVGLVFQNADHQLVADTVWHEALFATRALETPRADAEAQADDLLQRAGLADRKRDHPYRLSWGQKRRLNIISAVLHRPRLLLLDEPFAGQDWENVAFLLEIIDQVLNRSGGGAVGSGEPVHPQQRGACLMVTHDPRVVQRSCTRVLFVSDGRITLDASMPEAFQRLRNMGHDAYAPDEVLSPQR
ncbi:MAG TPA: ATP-binding cassette domain-containing protein [Phycisphaerae bacterium]|nr:ATP-binding cassette domain-containing protein [Phycisphaerae bacterium]